MRHAAFALEAASHFEGAACDDGAAVAFVELAPDDDIGDAGLIFERNEDHPLGGAGALANEDEAGDRDPRAIGGQIKLIMPQASGRARPGWRAAGGLHENKNRTFTRFCNDFLPVFARGLVTDRNHD